MTFLNYLSIALGGALGAVLRFTISTLAQEQMGDPFLWGHFPWGTLVVNVVGSFLIGILFQFFDQTIVSPDLQLLLLTGGLGAFTTFSTYSLETFHLIQDGRIALGILNMVISTAAGLVAVFLGIYLVRLLSSPGSP